MGIDLKTRNQAQVSMNLTDFEQTPIHRVFEMVKREAEELGVTVAGSEIIGLVPQKALEMSAEFYLQIENFRPELVFENCLNALLEDTQELAAMKIADFLESVAATNPVPGGGSVAALAGALAAALGKMAIGFTLHKKGFESHQAGLQEFRCLLEDRLAELRRAIDRDAQAYAQVVAAQQLPKSTEQEKHVREQRLQEALRSATDVPMQVAELASRVMQSLLDLRPITNPHVASDLNVGFWMALAAAEGALDNVLINLESLPESEFVATRNQRYQALKSLLKQLGTSNL
jgi:glutamate formiminotransferase/formiminotetrahydrofolate cyclodeaminase